MGQDCNKPKPSLSRHRAEFLPGRGYYVADPDGRRVSGFYHSEDVALNMCATIQADADAASKRKRRPCMCCGAEFMSEGIHNRMCDGCRRRASNDEAVPFSFGAVHGRKRA
jgi:hypothetical protein